MASERLLAGIAAAIAIPLLLSSHPARGADPPAKAPPASPGAGASPSAADKETARSLMKTGDQKMAAKDYKGALRAYETAHTIMGVPTTGVAVARARAALGQLIEAREIALEVARSEKAPGEPEPFTAARADAAKLAKDLEGRIPALVVQVKGPKAGAKAEITLDGQVIPSVGLGTTRKVNPGEHVITASSDGFAAATSKQVVREREAKRVTLQLTPGEGGEEDGGGGTSPDAYAAARDGLNMGITGGAMLVVPFEGGLLFGGVAGLMLNIGVTPKVDLRFGASAAFHGGDSQAAGSQDVLLYLGTPIMARYNLTSRFAVAGGLFVGFGTDFGDLTGFAAGPEWSLVSLRLGDKREIEIDFSQGFRFGNTPAEYHNGFVVTYLLLDEEGR